MNGPVPKRPICRRCAAALDADDNYCRRCGAATAFGITSGLAPSAAKQSGIWESPWLILPLLFLVLGPFAFPLLWRSRQFTLFWKVFLTVLVTGLTVFLLWSAWVVTQQALAPLQKLLQGQGF
jgi:hypothetical protein